MDFDEILPDVGSFGLYQKLVICVILLPAVLPCAFHAYSQLFIAARPAHWCRVPQLEPYVHEFPDLVKNLSVPRSFEDGEYQYSECKMYLHNYSELLKDVHSSLDFFTKFQNQSVIDGVVPIRTCLYGWNYDKSVFTSTVVQEFNLVCDKDFYATIALVVFGVGGLLGNYVFGYLQDMWGRRPSFYVYLILEIVGCTLSAFAWNYGVWVTMRFIVGLTVPAILASPYVLGELLNILNIILLCCNISFFFYKTVHKY
jgi:MFS transporter, OCT family, solute carrier family 22 (organic cation transporter), member 4/5